MPSIEVIQRGAGRAADGTPDAASSALLALLGFSATATPRTRDGALGDALVAVAEALGLPLPSSLVACASVVLADRGHLRIGHVVPDATTARAVAESVRASGGRLVVMADATQRDESPAEALRAELGAASEVDVMGVVSLGEAVDRLFDLESRATAGTIVPAERREAARRALFDRTIHASRAALDWPVVAAIAVGLTRHVPEDDVLAQLELELVRDVALRHAGGSLPIPWPEDELLEGRTHEDRLTILAHIVQAAADGAWEPVPEYVRRARQVVGVDRGPGALRLMGAMGRALAAVGDFDDASRLLDDAIEGWVALNDPGESSHALCERLRVAGILGRRDEVVELRARAAERLIPAFSTDSLQYAALAVGRALAQVGAFAEAMSALSTDALGAHARDEVRAGALRWMAFAARGAGDLARAGEAIAALEGLGETDQLLLARLDAGPLDAAARRATVRALIEGTPEARRLAMRVAPGVSAAALAERPAALRRLRAEYRY